MKAVRALAVVAALAVAGAHAFGTNCHRYTEAERKQADFPQPTTMPPNFKVVFLGDAGTGSDQASVLRMAVDFGAEVIVHAGDYDYNDSPSTFLRNIDNVVPESIVYLASIGNHDEDAWDGSNGYQALLLDRLRRSNASQYCTGDFAVNSACYLKGMYFVLSGVGTQGLGHVSYLEDAFSAVPAIWKVGVWHKNQRLYQTGGKSDETGYAILDAAREFGAIIATGHEHAYSRTYVMSDFARQTIASRTASPLEIEPGETFLFVSGLGGNSVRIWEDDLNENPWWAALAAEDNGALDGALFCTFNVGGNLRSGSCYFRDRAGKTFDTFEIINNNPATLPARAKSAKSCHVPFFDIAATSSRADAHENLLTNRVTLDAAALPLGGRNEARQSMSAIRFEDVPLVAGARIKTAHLQLFGVSSGNRDIAPKLTIRGERSAVPAPFGEDRFNLSRRALTEAGVAWTEDEDDFTPKGVWVSPDIKDILAEIIAQPGWRQGNAVVLAIHGMSHLEVSSFDRNECHAPSLIIELEADC